MPIFSNKDIELMEIKLDEVLEFHSKTNNNIVLIAHRGMGPTSLLGATYPNANIPPENTLSSFKKAIIEGCDGFELDIFKSKDSKIMVIHDDELHRNVYGQDRRRKPALRRNLREL